MTITRWTYEQALAWALWGDEAIVARVSAGGDTATVDRLLDDRRRARRHAKMYDHPSSIARRAQSAPETIPTPLRSRREFEAAIESGRLFANEDGLFQIERVKSVFPPPDDARDPRRGDAEPRPFSSPPAADQVAQPLPNPTARASRVARADDPASRKPPLPEAEIRDYFEGFKSRHEKAPAQETAYKELIKKFPKHSVPRLRVVNIHRDVYGRLRPGRR